MKAFLVTFVLVALVRINVVSACNGCQIKSMMIQTTKSGDEYMKINGPADLQLTPECEFQTSSRIVLTFPDECLKFESATINCTYNDMETYTITANGCKDYNAKLKNNERFTPIAVITGLESFDCENPCGMHSTSGQPYSLKEYESKLTSKENEHISCDVIYRFDDLKKIVKLHVESRIGCKRAN